MRSRKFTPLMNLRFPSENEMYFSVLVGIYFISPCAFAMSAPEDVHQSLSSCEIQPGLATFLHSIWAWICIHCARPLDIYLWCGNVPSLSLCGFALTKARRKTNMFSGWRRPTGLFLISYFSFSLRANEFYFLDGLKVASSVALAIIFTCITVVHRHGVQEKIFNQIFVTNIAPCLHKKTEISQNPHV